MLRLEPVVARFVAQIFGLLREATVGDLAELRAAKTPPERRRERVARRPFDIA